MPTIEEQRLVLPLKHGKYYYLNIDENTDKDRYYLYTEIIVPCNKLVDSTSNYIYISFMSQDITSIPDDELSDYENGLDPYRYSSLSLNIQKISNTLYCDSAYRLKDITGELEGDLFTKPDSFESSNFKIENFTDSFITVSLMILPEINKPLKSVGSSTDYSTLLLFINGTQIDHVGATTKSHVLPVYKFYNSDSSIAQIVCNIYYLEQEDQIPYMIWNTEYERFIYKDLALMCYKDYTKTKKNISSNMVNYPLFDSCFRFISYGGPSNNFSSMFAPYSSPYIKYTFDTNTLQQEGFKFYKVYKIIGKNPGNNIKLRIYITQAVDDNYNVFNYRYSKTDYSNITPRDVPDTDIIGIEFNLDETKDEEYIIIYLRYYNNQLRFGSDHIYSLSDDVYPTERTVQLTPGTYYNINITTVKWYSGYHVKIEDISYSGNIPYPRDITTEEKNSLFMSPNNYHWKSLWKYNRTIEYSSPLQDNPVILPLNVFTDDENENMFIEFIISPTSGTISDWGISLFDTGQFTGTSDNNAVVANSLFLNNGIEYSYRNNTLFLNIVQNNSSIYQTNRSLTITSSSKFAFMMYYNSANKKLILKDNKEGYKEITEISKDILRNIYSHMTTASSITINFGPTSDYFQDYIDEILDQDNKPTQEIQIINKNIVKDLQFYNISDIIGGGDEVDISSDVEVDGVPSYTFIIYPYSQATYNVVITIKPPFIAPEDAAKINESSYLIFSNSNLASYQYSYGVYNTDNMRLGYTLVFNRTHVPESTTEDVKKNNTDIIQISSSDGKYKYKITLKTIDVLKQGYFRFTSFDVPHTTLIDLGEAAGQHSFSAVYNLYFESNISKYFITTDTGQWDEIISNTTIKAIGETSLSEATIIKNIKLIIEYAEPDRYINGRIEFKVNSQDINFDQFNFRFTATYRFEELGIETTDTSPVITIFGSEYTG